MSELSRLLRAPTVEQVVEEHGEPPVAFVAKPQDGKEVVALATAVFESVAPRIYDSHRMLTAWLAANYDSNFWMLPCQERMPFPDAPLYALATMFRLEKLVGRAADWFLWVEDDVSVPQDIFKTLRDSADPKERPFVCAPGFTRNPPFWPCVWDYKNGAYARWNRVPESGVYKVAASGLVAALFHRSLFNRVPQPWFAVTSNKMILNDEGKPDVDRGLRPDGWWADQLRAADIPTYVNCDVNVTHFGMPLPVNKHTVASIKELPFIKDHLAYERNVRGLPTGDSRPLYAGVRQGALQGVDGAHAVGHAPGANVPAPESRGSVLPQTPATPCPKLSNAVSVDESPGLWRDWQPFAGK